MICEHCGVANTIESWERLGLKPDTLGGNYVNFYICPNKECGYINLKVMRVCSIEGVPMQKILCEYPNKSRAKLFKNVPEKYNKDYKEACAILSLSHNASATLSRRCLQNMIRDEYKIIKGSLEKEIIEVEKIVKDSTVCAYLHAIRQIGNFGAHPTKDNNTGVICDVEPIEAELSLDLLESFFDFTFEKKKAFEKSIVLLNSKLKAANKPEINIK